MILRFNQLCEVIYQSQCNNETDITLAHAFAYVQVVTLHVGFIGSFVNVLHTAAGLLYHIWQQHYSTLNAV